MQLQSPKASPSQDGLAIQLHCRNPRTKNYRTTRLHHSCPDRCCLRHAEELKETSRSQARHVFLSTARSVIQKRNTGVRKRGPWWSSTADTCEGDGFAPSAVRSNAPLSCFLICTILAGSSAPRSSRGTCVGGGGEFRVQNLREGVLQCVHEAAVCRCRPLVGCLRSRRPKSTTP